MQLSVSKSIFYELGQIFKSKFAESGMIFFDKPPVIVFHSSTYFSIPNL